MNNTYINIGVNNGSEKGTEKTLRLVHPVGCYPSDLECLRNITTGQPVGTLRPT